MQAAGVGHVRCIACSNRCIAIRNKCLTSSNNKNLIDSDRCAAWVHWGAPMTLGS